MKDSTMVALITEIRAARKKFPKNEDMMTALTEEVGEVAQALIEHKRSFSTSTGRELAEAVFKEAIQVACMAIRLAEEGSAEFPYEWREQP